MGEKGAKAILYIRKKNQKGSPAAKGRKRGKKVLTKGGVEWYTDEAVRERAAGSGRERAKGERREVFRKKDKKRGLTKGLGPDRIIKLHRAAEERKGKSGWKPKKFLKKVLDKA